MNPNQDLNNEDSIEVNKINPEEIENDEKLTETDDKYKFGWSNYSEITNG